MNGRPWNELTEPRLHSHVTDALADGHPRAFDRIRCDRCETLLHLQSNSCMRTWVESGCGNFCLQCFIAVAGGLAPDGRTRLAGADCLTRGFGLGLEARPRHAPISARL